MESKEIKKEIQKTIESMLDVAEYMKYGKQNTASLIRVELEIKGFLTEKLKENEKK